MDRRLSIGLGHEAIGEPIKHFIQQGSLGATGDFGLRQGQARVSSQLDRLGKLT